MMLKGVLCCLFFPLKSYKRIKNLETEILRLKEIYNQKESEFYSMKERAVYWEERALHKKHTVKLGNEEKP